MMIKKILVAVVAGTALMGGVAISSESTPENQTAGEKLDDGMLTMNVKAALIASPDTKAYQINVESLEGVVRLIGAVDSPKSKDAASTVAMSVKGVKEVKNELDVKLN
jgi:hyperosmotically inducible protein